MSGTSIYPPVPELKGVIFSAYGRPKTKYGTDTVVLDSDGNATYTLEVMCSDGEEADIVRIDVKAPYEEGKNPFENCKPMITQILLKNVRDRQGTFNNKSWHRNEAESFQLPAAAKQG